MQSGNFKMPSADGLNNLERGRALYNQGAFAESIPYFEEALKATERTFGNSAPELAEYLQELGDAYAGAQRASESLLVYDRLFRLGQQIIGPNHPQIISILWKMSILAERIGNNEDSFEMINQALARARESLRPDDQLAVQVVERYNYLSELLRQIEELKRRGEYVQPGQEQSYQDAQPEQNVDLPAHLNYQDVERNPFGQALGNAASRASFVNLDPLSSEAKVLDADLMARNAHKPQDGHLTNSSVLGQRVEQIDSLDSDYSLDEIENLTGRRTPKVTHGAGKSRKFNQQDNQRIVLGRLAKDILLPVVGLIVIGVLIVVAVLPALNGQKAENIKQAKATSKPLAPSEEKTDAIFETGDGEKQIRLLPDGRAFIVTRAGVTPVRVKRVGNDWGAYFDLMMASLSEKQLWFNQRPWGIVGEDGVPYYGVREPERRVIEKMRYLAGLAQGVFLRSGSYPITPPIGAYQEFTFLCPFNGKLQSIPIRQIPETDPKLDNLRLMLDTGAMILNESMSQPGYIACYSAIMGDPNSGKPKSIAFFVRGLDREGHFIGSSKPANNLVLQASEKYLNFKPLFRDQADYQAQTATTAQAKPIKQAKGKGKTAKVTAKQTTAAKKFADVPAEDELIRGVMTVPTDKPTRIWIMTNAPIPLSLIHYSLTIVLGTLAVFAFMASRMEGVNHKGQTVSSGSNNALMLSMILSIGAVLALILQLTMYR